MPEIYDTLKSEHWYFTTTKLETNVKKLIPFAIHPLLLVRVDSFREEKQYGIKITLLRVGKWSS